MFQIPRYDRITDGTNILAIDSAGKTSNNIYAWDNVNSIYRKAVCDSLGRLITISAPRADMVTIQIEYSVTVAVSPIAANQWQDVASYTVPSGYDLSCVMFQSTCANNQQTARAVNKVTFGTYNTATNTFTDGASWTLPKFAANMYVLVTTLIGSGTNDVITITYTNSLGATGRTGTVTIPKSSVVGTRLEVALQSGDIGVIDVTAVTHTVAGQAGAFTIEGTCLMFKQVDLTASQLYSDFAPLQTVVVPQGDTLYLQYSATGAAAQIRQITLVGTLVPRAV